MNATPVVVITGSSRGLGLATAEALLKRGARVMLSSESEPELRQVHARLSRLYGEQVARCCCDVRHVEQVQALLTSAIDRFGHVDTWINNAGTTAYSGPAVAVPVSAGRLVLDINIVGTYHGCIAALRHFKHRGRGRLINVVGRGEKGPVAGAALYGSSKAWIRQFSLALAKEEPQLGIGTFNPGLIYTNLTARPKVQEGQQDAMLKGLRFIMPVIGDTPERAARKLADLAAGDSPLRRENRARRLLPLVLKRLITGQRAPLNVRDIRPEVQPEDHGPIS